VEVRRHPIESTSTAVGRAKRNAKTGSRAVTWETVREIALKLPKVEEGKSYGTPAFRVGKQLFARLHQDGDCVVVRIDPGEREMRMAADPRAFFITDHYLEYPWLLVRFSAVGKSDLRDLLHDAWRFAAPASLVNPFDSD
jgi:hypothetical protein